MNWWFHTRAGIGRFMHQQYLGRIARSLKAEFSVYEGSVRMPWMSIGKGERPTLVFLHGFSDRKEGFLFAARFLAQHLNVIVPDLPGFGAASQDDHLTYDIRHYQQWVGEWLDQIPVERFHLMGNSLGGAIATEVAETHRHRIQSLCLIGSAGFLVEGHNQVYEEFLRGENFFLVENWEDYLNFRDRVFHRMPQIPKWVQLYLAEEAITKRNWYERIFVDMLPVKTLDDLQHRGEEFALNQQLVDLNLPTHLLWGRQDSLFPPAIAEHLHARLTHARLDILEDTGHVPHLENPLGVTKAFLAFLQEIGAV